MKLSKKILTVLLIFLVFNLFLPDITIAKSAISDPEIYTSPEKNIPVEKHAPKSSNKTLWVILGILVAGGAAAALGGGGGGGGGDSGGGGGGGSTSNTGSVTGSW